MCPTPVAMQHLPYWTIFDTWIKVWNQLYVSSPCWQDSLLGYEHVIDFSYCLLMGWALRYQDGSKSFPDSICPYLRVIRINASKDLSTSGCQKVFFFSSFLWKWSEWIGGLQHEQCRWNKIRGMGELWEKIPENVHYFGP